MKEVFIVAVLLCLEGCATRQPVNCDWRLKPINTAAPKAKAAESASKDPSIRKAAGGAKP